jgi:hypothetical protein
VSAALRRGAWSVQELQRLRQLLPRRGVEATALLLRRSPASVTRTATALLRVAPRRGDWTASDDALLRGSWGALEPRRLARMLGRPAAEVRRRAAALRTRVRTGAWTRGECQVLKQLYGTRADDDLEVCLSRPRGEIAAKAAELCLAKDKRCPARAGARMPRWTRAEVGRLRQLYPDHDNLEVARRIGRTVTSVANKAYQLGLRKSPALLADLGRSNIALRYRARDAAGASGA